jgi:hypothetical protein
MPFRRRLFKSEYEVFLICLQATTAPRVPIEADTLTARRSVECFPSELFHLTPPRHNYELLRLFNHRILSAGQIYRADESSVNSVNFTKLRVW